MARTRNQYLTLVFKFMAANGPFGLSGTEFIGTDDVNCDCCGKRSIHHIFHIKNNAGQYFRVGSECQEWVLELTDAHLPAAKVRSLSPEQLVTLGTKYGVTITVPEILTEDAKLQMAKDVITARRKYANTHGWNTRRQAKAAVQ